MTRPLWYSLRERCLSFAPFLLLLLCLQVGIRRLNVKPCVCVLKQNSLVCFAGGGGGGSAGSSVILRSFLHTHSVFGPRSRAKKKKRRGDAHKCMTEKTPLRLSVHTLICLPFTRLFRTATTATVARVAVLVLDLVVTVTKTAWTSPRRRRVRLSREGRRRHATSTATTALALALTTHS